MDTNNQMKHAKLGALPSRCSSLNGSRSSLVGTAMRSPILPLWLLQQPHKNLSMGGR